MRSIILILSFLGSVMPVLAHEGHSTHGGGNPYKEFGVEIDEQQAKDFSTDVIRKLVENRKLADSWNEAVSQKTYKKTFKNELEWVVMFENSNEKESEKRNLYIFLSLYGDFMGANFTGK